MPRHREFDFEKALDAAMLLFWEKGYEGTSYADLSEATGVARPGLYAAFGDKQSFFMKVLERYGEHEAFYIKSALNAPTAIQVVDKMIRHSAQANMQKGKPRGCLGINGALACSVDSQNIQQALNEAREQSCILLEARLQRALNEGDLPEGTDAVTLARLVMTLMQGVAVQAKAGVSKNKIIKVVDLALDMLQTQMGMSSFSNHQKELI